MRILLIATFCLCNLSIAVRGDLKSSISALAISAAFPGDASYASDSIPYNQRFTVSPAAIVYPKTPQDISSIVKLGAAQNMKVVARSGGHSYIANGLGGRNGALVVDMRDFSKVSVSSGGNAVIETGNRLGDVANALSKSGRALPHGTCPYVGIGGHAAFGGFGYTSRMWGLTLDTITAVNLVFANGTIARVTPQNDADLFWGLRGSAASFGIVTSYEVRTFPAPQSSTIFRYGWNTMDSSTAAKALSAVQNFAQTNIPGQLGLEIVLGKGKSSGTVYFELSGGWYGQPQDLDSVLAPLLRQLPSGPWKSIKNGSYIESVTTLAGGSLNTKPPERRDTFYAKSLMTPESSPITDTALLAFVRYLAGNGFSSNTEWFIGIGVYGGKNSAINAVSPDATAFAHRRSLFGIQFYASSPGNQPPFPQAGFNFVDGAVKAITSNSPSNWPYGAYLNYPDDRLADWKSRYYGNHYSRLQALKTRYDPRDVFDFPIGISA